MIYVPKEPIVDRITMLLDTADAKQWKKRDKVEVLTGLLFSIAELEVYDTENRTTDIVKELEPLVLGSGIGKDCYYCGHCKERVKRKDRFCRRCGYEFRREKDE